jgi:hypothetical protein
MLRPSADKVNAARINRVCISIPPDVLSEERKSDLSVSNHFSKQSYDRVYCFDVELIENLVAQHFL